MTNRDVTGTDLALPACHCGNHAFGFSCEEHGLIDDCPIHADRTREELIQLRSTDEEGVGQ